MTIKKSIISIVVKILIFAVLFGLSSWCFKTIDPVVANDIALGQMESSDDGYLMMRTYEMIRKAAVFIYTCLVASFTLIISNDIYNIIKIKKENF